MSRDILSKIANDRLARLFITLPVAITLAGLLLVLYGINRGFDWTDEAWAFSLTSNNHVSYGEPWAFQYLIHPILHFTGGTVINIRILRFTSYLLLAFFTAASFLAMRKSRGIENSRSAILITVTAAQLGTILAWSWPPRYFAYNEISAILVQLSVTLTALTIFLDSQKSQIRVKPVFVTLSWMFIGLTVGITFYGRFTGFLLLAPLIGIALIFSNSSRKIFHLIILSVSMGVSILTPALLGLPLRVYLSSIWLNLTDDNVSAANNHSTNLIRMYQENIWTTTNLVFPLILSLIIGVLLHSRILGLSELIQARTKNISNLFLFLSAFLAIHYFFLSGGSAERTGKIAIISLIVTCCLLIVLIPEDLAVKLPISKSQEHHRELYVPLILVAVSPVIASFGTNNPITIHFGFDATVWTTSAGIGIGILFDYLKANKRPVVLPVLIITSLASMSLFAAIEESKAPYRSASFFENKYLYGKPGPLNGLRLTQEEASWASWLYDTNAKLKANRTPTISIKSPGALLAFNNSDFASPWLESFWPASFWSISEACKRYDASGLIVLTPGTVPEGSPEWIDSSNALAAGCGINFPNDFNLVATRDSANPSLAMKIWQLKSK